MATASRPSVAPANLNRVAPTLPVAQLIQIRVRPDRRGAVARESLAHRVLHEFDRMPAMALTAAQATRIFQIPSPTCLRVLVRLVDDGKLRLTKQGRYCSCLNSVA